MTELVHWSWPREGATTPPTIVAWCYWRITDPAMLTDDPFAVTCGKCQRSKVVKAAAVAAF